MVYKPKRLQKGDTVVTMSLSWGGAGDPDILWRYEQGKSRLESFGLIVKEMPSTLKGSAYIYEHPEVRAKELMEAFKDPSIKGIFSCIGGFESIRMLPYIDFEVMRQNPKIFMGYSDSTITHLMLRKAGVMSYYGPSILMEFAENIAMFPYTASWVEKVLFEVKPIGEVAAPETWTGEYLPWLIENKHTARALTPRTGYEVLQGSGKVRGRLMGGCIEVLEFAKSTPLWPEPEAWQDALIFFETSEDQPSPASIGYMLRNYAVQGILKRCKGLLFGKPYQDVHYDAYKVEILKVLKEEGLTALPVFYNMAFGHTSPICTLPIGAMAEINCDTAQFTILESGVEA